VYVKLVGVSADRVVEAGCTVVIEPENEKGVRLASRL